MTQNPLENRFAQNSFIKQLCLIQAARARVVLIVVLSEKARQAAQKDVEKSLKKTLSSANNDLTSLQRVDYILISQEEWTLDNAMIAVDGQVNREKIQATYGRFTFESNLGHNPIVWEKS